MYIHYELIAEVIMQIALILIISLHVLSGVFWAGTTFAVARSDASLALRLFRPQMGAASLAIITGILLWFYLFRGSAGAAGKTLGVGIAAALAAAAVQGTAARLLRRPQSAAAAASARGLNVAQRFAAGLLGITVVCMAAARFA
jgi:hypothetical protein